MSETSSVYKCDGFVLHIHSIKALKRTFFLSGRRKILGDTIMDIGLKDSKKTITLLNQLLADETILYQKTRMYHWNVEGPHFNDLHKVFEEQYEALEGTIDSVAERIRTLGSRPEGTLAQVLKTSKLKEDSKSPQALIMVKNLLADHEAIIRATRKAIEQVEDVGTEDFLTGLLQEHEKTAWMLRSIAA